MYDFFKKKLTSLDENIFKHPQFLRGGRETLHLIQRKTNMKHNKNAEKRGLKMIMKQQKEEQKKYNKQIEQLNKRLQKKACKEAKNASKGISHVNNHSQIIMQTHH